MRLQGTTAAILAGGLGTRLRATVADRPKVLATVGGRPFLAYLLDQFAAAGLRRVVLCTGYLGDRVEEAFGKTYKGLELKYSREDTPLGTAGGLRLAAPLFEGDMVLVANGDSFCQVDLNAFVSWHVARRARGSLVLARVPNTSRFGRVDLGADETVLGFAEKEGSSGPGWINAGLYLLSKPLILQLPKGSVMSLEREVFPRWFGSGFHGYRSGARFIDIGTPDSYRESERFFAETIHRLVLGGSNDHH